MPWSYRRPSSWPARFLPRSGFGMAHVTRAFAFAKAVVSRCPPGHLSSRRADPKRRAGRRLGRTRPRRGPPGVSPRGWLRAIRASLGIGGAPPSPPPPPPPPPVLSEAALLARAEELNRRA